MVRQLQSPDFLSKKPKMDTGEKDSTFSNCSYGNRMSVCRRMKLDPHLSPFSKVNYKLIKDFSIRAETLKLPEGKVESMRQGTGTGEGL